MPVLTVTVESVQYPESGEVFVNFSDGNQLEFASRDDLASFVAGTPGVDLCRKLLVAAWLLRSPGGEDPAWVTGKTLQLDLSLDLGQLQIGAAS